MAAGLGFKTFTTGQVLTAADTNGYLMQGVLVFASAAARDAAITSPQEGQFAYLKDTNVTTYYTGSAWTNLDTTGMVNPMTTTGDSIYSSSGSTPARLGIGSTGQVLTVASGLPSWATPASGGMTLLSTTSLTGASTTISSIDQTYTNLLCYISGMTNATGNGTFRVGLNGSTTGHTGINNYFFSGTASYEGVNNTYIVPNQGMARTDANNSIILSIPEYSSTTKLKTWNMFGGFYSSNVSGYQGFTISGIYHTNTNAITSILFNNSGGNFSTGTVLVYGVK